MLNRVYSYFFNKSSQIRESFSKEEGQAPWRARVFSIFALFIFELLTAFLKFTILLAKPSYESFQVFTRQHTLPVCEYSYFDHKRFQKRVRLFSLAGLSSVISATIIINLILSLVVPGQIPSYAKTVNGPWDDWSLTSLAGDPPVGSAGSLTISPANTSEISGAGTDSVLQLKSTSYTATDDGAFSTTGSATGGTFAAGTNSSTTVSGSGAGASVALTQTGTANTWSTMAVAPGTVGSGGDLAYDGAGNIYALRGANTTGFAKYSISGNSWSTVSSTPASVDNGGALVYDGSGNMYAFRGGITTAFWKYTISTNAWSTMAVAPGTVGSGGDLAYDGSGNIYAFRGNTTTDFWKYTISTNTWSVMASTTANVYYGGALAYDGSGNIYGYIGNYGTVFLKYSISGNSWSAVSSTPSDAYSDSLVYDGSGNIYMIEADSGTIFWKYSISGNSWSTMAPTPTGLYGGGFLAYDGSGNIFALVGMGTTTFWKYSINNSYQNSGNFTSATIDLGGTAGLQKLTWNPTSQPADTSLQYQVAANNDNATWNYIGPDATSGTYFTNSSGDAWSTMAVAPGTVSWGDIIYDGSGNIYAMQGNSTAFWKYTISTNAWSTMAVAPGTVSAGGSLAYDGSGNIYAFRGSTTTDFWKYTISTNTWSTMAVAPGTVYAGGSLAYDGSGNIYAFRGSTTTDFWKYTISTNTWSTMAVAPGNVYAGGSLAYDGSGNIYAFRGSTTTAFWKYTISTNTWSTMAVAPGNVYSGGSLAYDGSGNIYAFRGDSTTDFWKYTISTNTWSTMAVAPGYVDAGGSLAYDGSGNIYALRGTNSTAFWKYTINPLASAGLSNKRYVRYKAYLTGNGNAWSTMAVAPGNVYAGGSLAYDGSGNIYAFRGSTTTDFWKYTISTNAWSTMAVAPGTVSWGDIIYDGSGNIYAFRGDSTTDFWKYSISTNTWSTMAVAPGYVDAGGSLAYDGSGNIYAFGGNTTTAFWKYTISTNTWSTMAVAPGTVYVGGSLSYDGSGNIYAFRGNTTTDFWKYTISTNTWSTMAVAPGTVSAGGSLAYDGSGNIYAFRGNTTTAFWKYTISTNAWSTMAVAPGTVYVGGSLSYDGSGNIYAFRGNTTTDFWKYSINSIASSSVSDVTFNYYQYPTTSSITNLKFNTSYTQVNWTQAVFVTNAAMTSTVRARARARTASSDANLATATFAGYNGTTTDASTYFDYFGSGQTNCSVADGKFGDTSGSNATKKTYTCNINTADTTYINKTGNQWLELELSFVGDGISTAQVDAARATYSVNSNPEVCYTLTDTTTCNTAVSLVASQSQSSANYGHIVFNAYIRDSDTNTGTTSPGQVLVGLEYSDSSGNFSQSSPPSTASYYTSGNFATAANFTVTPITGGISCSLTGATTAWKHLCQVNTASPNTFSQFTIDWNAKADLNGRYAATQKIRLLINDQEGINPVNVSTPGTSGDFTIDTANPTGSAIASVVPNATVALTSTDNSTSSYATVDSNAENCGSVTWPAYGNSISAGTNVSTSLSGWSFSANEGANRRSTACIKLRDQYGNESAVISAVTGPRPQKAGIQDVANVSAGLYKLFVSWEQVANTFQGSNTFSSYNAYRCAATSATDTSNCLTGTYSLVGSPSPSGDITNNSFTNSLTATEACGAASCDASSAFKAYCYRIATNDSAGNISNWVTVNASGVQLCGVSDGKATSGTGEPGISDTYPPHVSGITVSKTSTTAAISWTNSESAFNGVFYGTGTAYNTYPEKSSVVNYTTSPSFTVTGLTPSTTYNAQLKSVDVYGNTAKCDPTSSSSSSASNSGTATVVNLATALSGDPTATTYCSGTTNLTFTTDFADTAKPKILKIGSAAIVASVDSTSATINWQTNDSGTNLAETTTDACVAYDSSTAGRNYYSQVCGSSTLATTHSVALSNLAPDTTYYLKIKSTDANGNIAQDCNVSTTDAAQISNGDCPVLAASDLTFRTAVAPPVSGGGASGKQDFTAPVVGNIEISSITTNSAVAAWFTEESSSSFVEYGVKQDNLDRTQGQFDNVSSHSVALKDLSEGAKYYYKIKSVDWAGNVGESDINIFTTKGVALSLAETEISEAGKVEVQAVLEDLKKQIEEQGGSITDPLTALLNSVSSLIPEPIIIGEAPKVELGTTEATISWRTDKNSTSFVAFVRDDQYDSQKDEPYVSVVGNPEDSVKEHTVKVANILPATKYHYQVRSKALLGSMSKSKDFTFMTKSALPEISNYLQKKTEDKKTASVYWETNVPSDSVVKYTPYVSGKLEKKLAKIIGKSDMVTDHEVSVTELNPGTIYQFEISSRDPFGNVVSKVLPDFTTAIDKDAPVVSQVRIESAMVSGKTPRIQTIVSYKTDEPASGQVMFAEGGSNDFKEMAVETAFSSMHTAVITEFKPASIYRIRIIAKDNSENIATSRDFTILTPAKSESIIDIIVRTFENTFGWMKNIRF